MANDGWVKAAVFWSALGVLGLCNPARVWAQETIDVGDTGFDIKRPVLASACENGCPWGELGDFVEEAMKPLGYEVVQCRNCNRAEGPRLVSKASLPPELGPADAFVGTTTRFDAPVDFGITASDFLDWAYHGHYDYKDDGPYKNLRLIARIEDPFYLLVAVKADSPITDLAQIAKQKMPVKILGGGSALSQPVLDYYKLTDANLAAWGGSIGSPILANASTEFDVIISELGSPANNPESAFWPILSQAHDLRFLKLPAELLNQMVDSDLGLEKVTVKYGFLRGIDGPIKTVARSGDSVFGRDDTPDDAAYDVAKAIDQHRGALKWFIRPYSYDANTVHENFGVPLHPGAARYYREVGYLVDDKGADAGTDSACKNGGGCAVAEGTSPWPSMAGVFVIAIWLAWRRRTGQRSQG